MPFWTLSFLLLLQLFIMGLWKFCASQSHLEAYKAWVILCFVVVTFSYFYKIRMKRYFPGHLFLSAGWTGCLLFKYIQFASKSHADSLIVWPPHELLGSLILFIICGALGWLLYWPFKTFHLRHSQ